MIPKIIHYCWFGDKKKSKLVLKCIESWHKYCPDYEFYEWNENSFPIDKYPYAKYCFSIKNYAFLSDFVRLLVVYENGGIYLDTDVEVIKSLNGLLENTAYFGLETKDYINTGLGFGAEKGARIIKEMIDEYMNRSSNNTGDYLLEKCTLMNTRVIERYGFQKNGNQQYILEASILPIDYFNPYDDPTGILKITDNTYSIHWYSKSWMKKRKVIRSWLTKPIHRLLKKLGEQNE